MNSYNILREQIIQSWKIANPKVANYYNTVPNDGLNETADGSPVGSVRTFLNNSENELTENPLKSSLWFSDKQITNGKAYDISMDVAINGDLYIAVLGRLDGSAIKDSVYIYKSTNGGYSWDLWSSIYASTLFEQIELMCLDFGTTDNYLLLFYRLYNGWFRVGRRNLDKPAGWSYYTIASSGIKDFAVGRNNSQTKRVMCVYDSSTYIKSVRSDPASFGSVWQDVSPVGQTQLLGKDLDMVYGWNGSMYVTFNGFNSGNLFVDENTNYGDPASWQSRYTVAQGNVDTTRHAEIIASRENAPNNQVVVLFEKKNGDSYGIYDAQRDNGTWSPYTVWVTVRENKFPSMYISRISGSKLFRGAFEQSEAFNGTPRIIKYKGYTGTTWTSSFQISDATNDVTGIQKPEVADIDGNTPVIAYVGANYTGVFFDNSVWVTDVISEPGIPEVFSLEQNYPNPFNPSTKISWQSPLEAHQVLKVYDVLGNEVATLVNEYKPAGNYEVQFDASGLSSGVYFYQIEIHSDKLQTGNYTQTRKMILLR